MRTFPEIWRELPLEERRKAAAAFWAAVKKGDSGWQFGIDYLADRLRSRSVFIEKTLNLEKRIHHLAVQPNPPDILIRSCLQQLLLGRRPHILRRFVDVTGIPHVDGRIDSAVAYKREPPSREILEKAVDRVYSEFDGVEVRLYLDCLYAECPPFWVALPDARAAVEARRATGGAVEVVPVPPSGVTAPAAEVPTPASSRDPLTNLDHAVMDAVVASVAGGVGALPEDQIRDLVEEFVALNPKRLASYFHRGFLEVLAGREPTFDWPEANPERRAWYLCGALAALSRRSDRTAVVRLAEARPEETRALGSGEGAVGSAAAFAAPLLFEAFLEVKGPAAAAESVQPPAVAQAGLPFFRRVLEASGALLREQRPEEAGLLLDRLQGSIGVFEAFHAGPPVDDLRELRRRQAHRARLLGDGEKARALLESLVREGPGDRDGMIRADLGLIACGLRSLGEVRLPEDPSDRAETARVLGAGEKWFRESAGVGGDGGHGEFCLGTLLLARGDLGGALPLLSRAVSQMERRPEVYEALRVLSRARLYQARCLAATVDPGRMAHAAERLVAGARGTGGEGVQIVREALVDIASCDPEAAARAAVGLEPVLGDAIVDAARDADLLSRLPALREGLARRAEDEARAPALRFEDFETLLRVGRQMGDIEVSRRALDGLEGLAQIGGTERERFLGRLADEAYFRPAWDPEDAALFRVRSLEAAGRLPEAASVLTTLAFEFLARGGHDEEEAARGLVERIRALGVVAPDEGLVRRLDAASTVRREEAPVATAPVTGSIVFFGGNESQERYREEVLRWATERWPGVTLTLESTGWSSNWGRELPRYENLIGRADAVVIMRFVRTLLGMHLRRMCGQAGIPWVACTGHGRDSMKNSIAAAVARCSG